MDSNFQVKITADLSEFYKSIQLAANALTKLDGVVRDVGKASDYASSSIGFKLGGATSDLGKKTKTATQDVDSLGNSIKKATSESNRGRLVAFAFGQVIRDAGFFSRDFGLGLLAISNNIPILIDQLVALSKVSDAVGSAISLVGSLITAGLTIWAYSSMAVKENKKSIDDYVSSLDDLREATLKGNIASDSELRSLNLLRIAAQDETFSKKERLKAVKELQDQFPDYYGNLSAETIMAGKDAAANRDLASAIKDVANAKAAEDLIKENRKIELIDIQKLISLQGEKISLEKQLADLAKSPTGISGSKTGENQKAKEAERVINNQIFEIEKQIVEVAKERNKARNNSKFLEERILNTLKEQKKVSVITGSYGEANKAASDLDKKLKDILIKLNGQTRDNLFKYVTSDAEVAEGKINSLLDLVEAFQKKLDSSSTTVSIDDQITEGPIIPVTPVVPFDIFTAKTKYDDAKKAVDELNNSVKSVVQTVGSDLVNAFTTMLETGTLSFGGIAKALTGMIKKLIAAAIAAAVLSMLLSSIFPGAKNTGFKDIFKMLSGLNLDSSKPMASGGIVSGPTRALVGEYPGARSNPEVVAPLDKLKSIIGSTSNNNQGGFVASTRISGNDLAIIVNRANKNRNGYY